MEIETLVDELLTAARLEAESLSLSIKEVDLNQAAREAWRRAAPRATLLKGKLALDTAEPAVMASADERYLARILDNLLNNALIYSAEAPEVSIRVYAEDNLARLAVRDRGRGIPPESWERIFERFARIEDPFLKEGRGSGLGLYLSRGLARAMGGEVELAASHLGSGSTFLLSLPIG
jgi:signal transduction histidine kinase